LKLLQLQYTWHTTDHNTYDTIYDHLDKPQVTSDLASDVYDNTEWRLRSPMLVIRLEIAEIILRV